MLAEDAESRYAQPSAFTINRRSVDVRDSNMRFEAFQTNVFGRQRAAHWTLLDSDAQGFALLVADVLFTRTATITEPLALAGIFRHERIATSAYPLNW